MATMKTGTGSAARRLLASIALAAGTAGLFHAPDAVAQAGARGIPMSRLFATKSPKIAGCIVPAASIVISPSSISFPTAVSAGSCSSGTQAFTVTNTGTKSAFISYVGLSPPGDPDPFNLSESCGDGTLAPGGSCSGTVQFCPYSGAAPGTLTQVLTVYHDAGTNSIPLSGTVAAAPPAPVFQLLDASISFGQVGLGEVSAPGYVTVQNVGSANLVVSSATTSAPFAVVSNTCGTVPPAGSCLIGVTYSASSTPTGLQYGTLTISHSATGSPGLVDLAAESAPKPGITLVSVPTGYTASPLNFYGVEQNTSATGTVYFTNLTGSALLVDNVGLSCGECGFEIVAGTDTCSGVSVPNGQSCEVGILFTDFGSSPPFPNTSTDTVQFLVGTNNYPSGLYAEVVPAYPVISITPAFADFGTVNLGSQSACQNFLVQNSGSQDATIFLTAPYYGEFVAGSCVAPAPACTATPSTSQTLLPAEQCYVSYQYAPTTVGQTYDDFYAVDANGWWGYVAGATLTGFGYQPGPRVQVDQSFLSFGTHPIGTSATPQTVTITNIGDASLTGYMIPPGPYGFTMSANGCGLSGTPVTLAPGLACSVTFGFTPTITGYTSDSATFSSNALNAPGLAVYMDGTGSDAPTPSADFYPMSLDFGSVVVPTTSPVKTVSFANTGSAPMLISSVISNAGDFAVTHDCPVAPSTLAAGTCCTLQMSFTPTVAGSQSGSVDVQWADPATPTATQLASIPVQGIGVPPPSITAAPSGVSFADQIVNTASAPATVVFSNTGITSIMITGLAAAPGTDFSVTALGPMIPSPASAPFTGKSAAKPGVTARFGRPKAATPACSLGFFPVGASCYVAVVFKPSALGLRTGVLSLAFTGGSGSPASVPLAGNGTPAEFPAISVSADSVAFGDVVVGTTASRTVTVSSTGTGPLAVTSVVTFGSYFSATTNCTASQAPGTTCDVTVTCRPDAIGPRDGDLDIYHSATGGRKHVSLSCNGVPVPKPKIDISLTSIGFGNQTLGTTSTGRQVLIRSVGTAPLVLGGTGTAAPFSAGSNCPASMEPGTSCFATVQFSPVRAGVQTGRLGIASNDPERPTAGVDLSGTGCRPFSLQAARRGTNPCAP